MQTQLLAEASWLAATADEDIEQNFVRKHVLAYQAEHGCDLEQAALRVFSNAEGAYGSNVNLMLDSGRWEDEEELADCYTQRKGFAYDRHGKVSQQSDLLNRVLEDVDLAYQNLDSVELGVTTVDHYFGTLAALVARCNAPGESGSPSISQTTLQAAPVACAHSMSRWP